MDRKIDNWASLRYREEHGNRVVNRKNFILFSSEPSLVQQPSPIVNFSIQRLFGVPLCTECYCCSGNNPCSDDEICEVENNSMVCKAVRTLCDDNETGIGTWTKPNWSFEQCQQQETLILQADSIQNLPEQYFKNNVKVSFLSLWGNNIQEVPEQLFTYNVE